MEAAMVRLAMPPNATEVTWPEVANHLELEPVWAKTQPDACWWTGRGASRSLTVVEVYARVTKLLPGNRSKVCKDVLKLASIREAIWERRASLEVNLLVVVPRQLEAELHPSRGSWMNSAIHQMVQVTPVDLSGSQVDQLLERQLLQRR